MKTTKYLFYPSHRFVVAVLCIVPVWTNAATVADIRHDAWGNDPLKMDVRSRDFDPIGSQMSRSYSGGTFQSNSHRSATGPSSTHRSLERKESSKRNGSVMISLKSAETKVGTEDSSVDFVFDPASLIHTVVGLTRFAVSLGSAFAGTLQLLGPL